MSRPELTCDNCGRFVPQLESAQLREATLRTQNAELLAALEAVLPVLDHAWERAIMNTEGAPMAAKLAKIKEGSPEANQARAAIAQAKGESK